MVPLAVVLGARSCPRVGEPDDRRDVAVPWRPIVLVGLAMVLFYMVDTAATTWGPTYLDDTFPHPERLVALATFPYLVATLVCGWPATALVAATAPVPVLRAGAVVASASPSRVVVRAHLAGGRGGLHPARAGAAVIAPLQLLGRRPDRGRRGASTRCCGRPAWTR